MGGRKKIPKEVRERVYKKYDGRCAYCGEKLEYKNMQVDHLKPLYLGGVDDEDNYMPSCRACNFYKGTMTIEKFRHLIETSVERLRKSFVYKMAVKYGMVVENPVSVQFLCDSSTSYEYTPVGSSSIKSDHIF